jgi:hypothetical protein
MEKPGGLGTVQVVPDPAPHHAQAGAAVPDETPLDIARSWIEFPDPATPPDAVPSQVFRADLTWLTSSWTCIYGRGCQGIYADRPDDGCCTLGAHFSGTDDEERVSEWVSRLGRKTWQRISVGEGAWTEVDEEGARKTRVVDGACIFLNDPGFDRPGCALHHLAAKEKVSFVETKPDVCWQLPIRRTYRTVERPDGTSYLEVTLTEYDRRGWGEGGHNLDWYCSANPKAHVGAQPVYLACAAELTELIGEQAYAELTMYCEGLRDVHRKLPLFLHPATAANPTKKR